jgi:hypothetical protein
MLQTFNELTNQNLLVNDVSTITDWSRMSSPTSPFLFKEGNEENINIIKKLLKENKYSIFLRKVDRSFPDQTIYDLMDYDCGHNYDMLHNVLKLKKKASHNIWFWNMIYILFIGTFVWLTMSV